MKTRRGGPKKADRIKADKMLQAWLEANGEVKGPHGTTANKELDWPIDCPEYYLPTAVGQLRVYPASTHGTCYCVYCRFEEPERARVLLGDSVSRVGKWNHYHFENNITPEIFVAFMTQNLAILGDFKPMELGQQYVICHRQLSRADGRPL